MKKIIFNLLILLSVKLYPQGKPALKNILTQDDSIALTTVATYPDSIRPYILTSCQNPEILLKAEALQKSTSQSFRNIADDYTKDEQKKLWDISRYPGLLAEITTGGKKSKEELEIIAAKYPKELKETITESGRKHFDALTSMNNLYNESQKEFENIIAPYPEATQSAYRHLISKPDALNLLSNNMHLVVILGDMYKSNSGQTMQMLDSVKTEHNIQSAKDLEDWKAGLEKNPEAKKELEQAAQEFTSENKGNTAYEDDVYKTGGNSNTQAKEYSNPPVMNNYYLQPYPYWFGYPFWFDYPYWYPYPFWFNSGFYWGPGGMVFIGFPSPFFMHWYLFHPYHNYYYSHFTDYCIGYNNYHYGPRNVRSGFNSEVNNWKRANEPNLPKGFFNNDVQRPDRIKELGKFESDYHNVTKGVFGKNISRSEFLQNNSDFYPHIKPVISQPRFNQPIRYPQQQNPVKFNMGPYSFPVNTGPGRMNLPTPRAGGMIMPRR